MARYRVIDPQENVIEEKEFPDATAAYDWFKSVEAPGDELGYAMQVEADGEWKHFESNDGGTSPHESA